MKAALKAANSESTMAVKKVDSKADLLDDKKVLMSGIVMVVTLAVSKELM